MEFKSLYNGHDNLRQNGGSPSKVRARNSGTDQAALDRLEDLRATLEEYRQGGLTNKNLSVVRKVLTPGVWRNVVNLPSQLMCAARADGATYVLKHEWNSASASKRCYRCSSTPSCGIANVAIEVHIESNGL